MKTLFSAIAMGSLCCLACGAAEPANGATNSAKVVKKSTMSIGREINAYREKMLGGVLRDTRNQKGRAVVVNAQKAASAALVSLPTKMFADGLCVDIGVESGTFDFPSPRIVGEATLYVIDDPKMPGLLSAPENRWAMVNVAPLKTERAAFFETRVQKEVMRGLCLLLGAADSRYPLCLTGCVLKPTDLDKFADLRLPDEMQDRFLRYMEGLGITPYVETTYYDACQEGWAAAPTNKWQRRVWERVHAIPAKPIKIEYNEKRDKGK